MTRFCQVIYDLPFYDLDPVTLDRDEAFELGLGDDERELYNQILKRDSEQFMSDMRRIFRDVTGQSGESLSYGALAAEIEHKSVPADVAAARARLSRERADGSVASGEEKQLPIERFFRLGLAAGDTHERNVAAALGAARARLVRDRRFVVVWSEGCPHN
jgi:hypothetical protein